MSDSTSPTPPPASSSSSSSSSPPASSHKRKRSSSPELDPEHETSSSVSKDDKQVTKNGNTSDESPSTSPFLKPSITYHTRIGSAYQISSIPIDDHTSSSSDIDGYPVWQASKCDAKLVDEYLGDVAQLFHYSDVDYSEELALEFLHHCDYDTVMALNLLLPAKIEEDVEEDVPPRPPHESDDICAICGDGGQLIICDGTNCKRVYHVACTGLGKIPSGRWECSAHFCTICRQHVDDTHMMCVDCPTSYCPAHCPPELKQRSDQIKLTAFRCITCTEKQHHLYIEERQHVIRAIQKILMGATGQGSATQSGGVLSTAVPKVDLAQLYKAIQERGGIETVMSTSAWREIAKMFHLSTRPTPSTTTTDKDKSNDKPATNAR